MAIVQSNDNNWSKWKNITPLDFSSIMYNTMDSDEFITQRNHLDLYTGPSIWKNEGVTSKPLMLDYMVTIFITYLFRNSLVIFPYRISCKMFWEWNKNRLNIYIGYVYTIFTGDSKLTNSLYQWQT